MTPTTTCQPTTVADLAQAGFTPEQIECLSLLRDVYPLLEFLETAEVRRLSDQLTNKAIAALRIDQQAALRRYQSEQLRVQRLNLITQSMAAAGLPLTPEQKQQVEALYARESRLRTLIVVEAKGQPHGAKVAQLETQTTQSVVLLMNQTQKTALAQAMAKSRTR